MDLILILLMAIAIDLTIGEYPAKVHPTVWAGRLVGAMINPGFRLAPGLQFIYGSVVSLLIISLFTLTSWFLLVWFKEVNYWLYVTASAIILKPAFCLSQQWRVAQNTRAVIESKTPVPSGMKSLFDTVNYERSATRGDITSASIRSIAENASDFVTGPLFYYLFLGVPGAVAYRVINTLDNMIGYRGKFEYLGKFAARLDDVFSFVPARITALLFVVSAAPKPRNVRQAWQTMKADHSLTPGPNGGWPMAAAAGALGVKLYKTGHYELGGTFVEPSIGKITEAVSLYRLSVFTWTGVCLMALAVGSALRG
ncbi:adenosylcobinamide-phosphate synthase CbiB [Dehalogenimonas alkenigignens]|uniref:adenosylcobinamide-phosphate synthase CbiB n=1 Tax=Dehalogenimonas alkenigignens TaxID=1217799 RepID=UPI000D574E5D|nr:adenosylcobinamide-phosphate synthase CbiB [Dehalogenimonas alkenigignens]PVV82624.1 cobalamin biosynthesis protein CobD [Dehalogenimonas alkenigignens]